MKKWSNQNKLKIADRYLECAHPIIAITGGIGCGKSTFCDLLEQYHYPVLRADQIVKQVYTLNDVQDQLRTKLPEVFVSNQIDFQKLRSLFFNNSDVKNYIENLIYRYMPQIFRDNLTKINLSNNQVLFYEIPLIFEKQLTSKFDFIICISIDRQEQIKRIQARDYQKKSEIEIEKILTSQLPLIDKEKGSHLVIYNKDKESLTQGLKQFEQDYLPLLTQQS